MDKQTEAFILMLIAAMKDVAESKNNSRLTQLKAQIKNSQGKMKKMRIILVPEDMEMEFPTPLST